MADAAKVTIGVERSVSAIRPVGDEPAKIHRPRRGADPSRITPTQDRRAGRHRKLQTCSAWPLRGVLVGAFGVPVAIGGLGVSVAVAAVVLFAADRRSATATGDRARLGDIDAPIPATAA